MTATSERIIRNALFVRTAGDYILIIHRDIRMYLYCGGIFDDSLVLSMNAPTGFNDIVMSSIGLLMIVTVSIDNINQYFRLIDNKFVMIHKSSANCVICFTGLLYRKSNEMYFFKDRSIRKLHSVEIQDKCNIINTGTHIIMIEFRSGWNDNHILAYDPENDRIKWFKNMWMAIASESHMLIDKPNSVIDELTGTILFSLYHGIICAISEDIDGGYILWIYKREDV